MIFELGTFDLVVGPSPPELQGLLLPSRMLINLTKVGIAVPYTINVPKLQYAVGYIIPVASSTTMNLLG